MRILILTLAIAGCGSLPEASETTKEDAQSSAEPTGGYARLLETKDDEPCTIEEINQLVYVRAESGFFYCSDKGEWTAIDLRGKDGADGKDGINGNDGRDGRDGENGTNGVAGYVGKDGVDGQDGEDGIDGQDGAPGANMLRAYDSNSITTINTSMKMVNSQLTVMSDGSLFFTAEVFFQNEFYFPSFFIAGTSKTTSTTTILRGFMGTTLTTSLYVKLPSGNTVLGRSPNHTTVQYEAGWSADGTDISIVPTMTITLNQR